MTWPSNGCRVSPSVQPGEVSGCSRLPRAADGDPPAPQPQRLAAAGKPSRIEPVADCPDVFDFPRDIQPILDQLCVDCHGYEKTARGGPYAGRVLLSGDHGPMFSHAYVTMTIRRLFSDNRNQPRSNYPPRALGSSASRILTMLDGAHHGVRADAHQRQLLRLWIDVGAPYPGTYAALGCGSIGGYYQNNPVNCRLGLAHHPGRRRGDRAALRSPATRENPCCRDRSATSGNVSFWRFDVDDPGLRMCRHLVFNLTRPEKSLLLAAPLARAAGGLGLCRDAHERPAVVFATPADPDYWQVVGDGRGGQS